MKPSLDASARLLPPLRSQSAFLPVKDFAALIPRTEQSFAERTEESSKGLEDEEPAIVTESVPPIGEASIVAVLFDVATGSRLALRTPSLNSAEAVSAEPGGSGQPIDGGTKLRQPVGRTSIQRVDVGIPADESISGNDGIEPRGVEPHGAKAAETAFHATGRETFARPAIPIGSSEHRPVSALTLKPLAPIAQPEGTGGSPRRLEFALDPEHLGRVRISINVAAGRASVKVVAATPAGFAALNADREALLPILREIRGSEGELRVVLQCEPTGSAQGTGAIANEVWSQDRWTDRSFDRWGDRSPEGRMNRPERNGASGRDREAPAERGQPSRGRESDDTL